MWAVIGAIIVAVICCFVVIGYQIGQDKLIQDIHSYGCQQVIKTYDEKYKTK